MVKSTSSRRSILTSIGAVGMLGLAGCTGGQDESSGDGTMGGPAGTLGPWSLDVESPMPIQERINGQEWIPPEFDQSEVASSIQSFNLGGMENDPATAWYNEKFTEETGIEVEPIEVPSSDAVSKMTTVLSAGTQEPVLFQVSQEFYMDFVANGWFEPADILWSSQAYDAFPPYYETDAKTDLDPSLDGEHSYVSPHIAEGHAMNYNPELLSDLGFPEDFYDDATWADVREVSEEAAAQSKDYFGYVWYGKGNRYPVYPWLSQLKSYGGAIVQQNGDVVFNSDEGVRALEWQRQMIDDELVPDVLQYGEGGPQDLFLGERLVGFVGGADIMGLALSEFGEDTNKYSMGLPPSGAEGDSVAYMNTDFLAINRAAPVEKKRAALIYMDGRRSAVCGAYEFDMEGNFPVNSNAWEHPILSNQRFASTAERVTRNMQVELWPNQIRTYDAVVRELQEVWLQQKEPQEALDDVQSRVDDIMGQA